jgi:hypothetical protein
MACRPVGLLVGFHRGSIPGSDALATTSADSDKENGKFLSGHKKKLAAFFVIKIFEVT